MCSESRPAQAIELKAVLSPDDKVWIRIERICPKRCDEK